VHKNEIKQELRNAAFWLPYVKIILHDVSDHASMEGTLSFPYSLVLLNPSNVVRMNFNKLIFICPPFVLTLDFVSPAAEFVLNMSAAVSNHILFHFSIYFFCHCDHCTSGFSFV
jgi:hypothetical protein